MKLKAITRYKIHYIRIFAMVLFLTVLLFINSFFLSSIHLNTPLLMGGRFYRQFETIETGHTEYNNVNNEKYFRPSKLPILNTRIIDSPSLTPKETIINYFTLLSDAENLTKDKIGGCGTVGNAKLSFPIAYSYFTDSYKEKVSYNNYLKSFEGIGRTNLIKIQEIPSDQPQQNGKRFFLEIETIEGSSKQMTYFGYYYGFINMKKENGIYKINDLELFGEDFLCAPYHGWAHIAEVSVDIKYGNWCSLVQERYPTKQEGFIKNVFFKGTDSNDYLIVFLQLTNDTDVEIAQYRKNANEEWELIDLDPEKCLKDK